MQKNVFWTNNSLDVVKTNKDNTYFSTAQHLKTLNYGCKLFVKYLISTYTHACTFSEEYSTSVKLNIEDLGFYIKIK